MIKFTRIFLVPFDEIHLIIEYFIDRKTNKMMMYGYNTIDCRGESKNFRYP